MDSEDTDTIDVEATEQKQRFKLNCVFTDRGGNQSTTCF